MSYLKELYEREEGLRKKEVKNAASAQKRHIELKKVEAEIAYYEEGDTISKALIQEKLLEIKELEAQYAQLAREIEGKKRQLNHYIYGAHTVCEKS